jgi:arylsulfatase A-like enzyme
MRALPSLAVGLPRGFAGRIARLWLAMMAPMAPLVPMALLAALAAALCVAGCGADRATPPAAKLVRLGDLIKTAAPGAPGGPGGSGGPEGPGGAGGPGGPGGQRAPGAGGEQPAAGGGALPALAAGSVSPDAPYQAAVDVSASRVGRLRLTLAGSARLATLSWRLAQDRVFTPFRAVSFPLAGDGKPHPYEVDLEREAHWHGRVVGLRLEVDAGSVRLLGGSAAPPDDAYRSMSLGGETMPALSGGGRLTLPLPPDLPAGTHLEVHLGLIPEYDKPGVTATFRVRLEGPDGKPADAAPGGSLLEETLAGGGKGGPAWRLVRRDLPAGDHRTGDRLVLESDAVRDGAALPEGAAVWGNPMLVRPGPPAGNNLVVILIDTLRADALGAYGDTHGLTPRLDAFARDGVRFAEMLSPAPWTLPSVCSLLTGLQPQTHGAGQRFGDFDPASPRQNDFAPTGLPGGVHTLAGVLAHQGFYSLGIYQNFYILPGFGVHQGFDDYTSIEDRAEVLVDRALAELRRTAPDRRTFLYLHLFDLHSPYSAPEPECTQVAHRLAPGYRGPLGCEADRNPERTTIPTPGDRPWFEALYRAEVAYTDRQVGRFLDGLRDLGLADHTVVAVVSDHGEEFWGRLDREAALGYEPNSDHGHTLYQELVHVPALLRIPGRKPAVVPDAVQMVDLFPTLLHAVGAAPSPSQGTDLTPLLDGKPLAARETPMADVILHGRPRWSVRRGPWKLVVARDPALPVELYNLDRDPAERTNLAGGEPQTVAALRAIGERELATRLKARATYLQHGDTLGATYLEWRYITKLRALGYLR